MSFLGGVEPVATTAEEPAIQHHVTSQPPTKRRAITTTTPCTSRGSHQPSEKPAAQTPEFMRGNEGVVF